MASCDFWSGEDRADRQKPSPRVRGAIKRNRHDYGGARAQRTRTYPLLSCLYGERFLHPDHPLGEQP
eukprot:scaffold144774_cov93-Phaeocystis_antarctica.AAC.1